MGEEPQREASVVHADQFSDPIRLRSDVLVVIFAHELYVTL